MPKRPLIQTIRENWPIITTAGMLLATAVLDNYRINQLEGRTGWMKSQQEAINKLREDVARIDERTKRGI